MSSLSRRWPLPESRFFPPLDVLTEYSAVALFIQRATAVKPDFELNEDNAEAVIEICERLDGLPLAIELAAARIKFLTPADLLSVFVGGCTLEGVEAVCITKADLELDFLDGMASLVDKSLVQQIEQTKSEPRFAMLETIREYGLEKLAESEEDFPTRRAHAAYCVVLAEDGAAQANDAQREEWLDRFAIEHDNFRAALEWLTSNNQADWGLRLGVALFPFWETREYLAEGRDRLGKLLNLSDAKTPTKQRARALFAAGVLAIEQGDYASASKRVEESLQISRDLDDKNGIGVSLNALAVHARDCGDISASRSLFEESLDVWRESGDRLAAARALSNLAHVARIAEDFGSARALYEDCLSIFRELNDQTGVAWTLNHQGDVVRQQGDLESARLLYEQSLATFRELEDQWGIAGSLADLGNLARDQKDFELAHSLYRESMRTFLELDHKRGIARLLECFACCAADQFKPERSLRFAGAAAALRQAVGAPLTPSERVKLERVLKQSRQALTHEVRTKAWLEGWALPLGKAVQEALRPNSARAIS
ncbi:MAG: ATP-binding protein [Pyrinomonadaceae bacterium]